MARVPLNYNALRDSENALAGAAPRRALRAKMPSRQPHGRSAGENFAYYFRKLCLGPVIGTRTWGGLTGLDGTPPLIDGGGINVPDAPFFDFRAGWLIENHGIDPAPSTTPIRPQPARSQLGGAAIAAMRKAIAAHPYVPPHNQRNGCDS